MGRNLVFAHANGFPAGTYEQLFQVWRAAGFTVHAIQRFGHDPAYPVTSNWPHLRDELIQLIERSARGPAYLVGHSMGGLISLMAACKRPDLALGLVMLDSPLFTGWRAHGLQVMKTTGLIKRASPGKVSSRRRHVWPSRAAVLKHFAAKAAFARWDERVLADYAAAGFDEREGQIELGIRREVETRIYDTLPHNLGRVLQRHAPRCPVAYVAGTQSAEARQGGIAAARALARERFEWFEGNHLFPMEHPEQTAALVVRVLQGMA